MPVSTSNRGLVEVLSRIAVLMDLLGEDSFKSSAHARAARAIEGLASELGPTLAGVDEGQARARLREIEGVGEKIAAKIVEYFRTGRIAEHDALASRVPAGLPGLLEIQGLGAKTVRAIWQTLGVTDVAGLKHALEDGSILRVPRMGEKAAEKIRQSLAVSEQGQSRLRLGEALPLAERIVSRLEGVRGVERVALAGSLRRGKETIGDIDILACVASEAAGRAVSEAFVSMPGVVAVLAAGDRKSSVRMSTRADLGRWAEEGREGVAEGGPSVQVDLRVVPRGSWGAALMYFTGSKEHNVALRQRALDRGLTLNEYGLFPLEKGDAERAPPQERGVRAVASGTEEEIYAALGLPMLPAEIREHQGELALSQTPRLVEVGDIRAELHAHTTASDGSLSIEELAARALERGFHTIAVTDHSQSSTIARGLRPDRLREHVEAVRKAQERLTDRSGRARIRVLAGSEVDILADGTLDYEDAVLAELDVVVASAHAALGQEPEVATRRLLAAIAHPRVHILGHPTGRLINRRAGLSPDIGALASAAAEQGVALEINSHWLRLDLRDTHARAAMEAGCLLAINCDVHEPEDFEHLRYGVLTARRGWVTPERCVNTWDGPRLWEWLASKRGGSVGTRAGGAAKGKGRAGTAGAAASSARQDGKGKPGAGATPRGRGSARKKGAGGS